MFNLLRGERRDASAGHAGSAVEPARVTILMLGHCLAVQKEKAPGHPGLSPLKRRLLGIALADQIAGQ